MAASFARARVPEHASCKRTDGSRTGLDANERLMRVLHVLEVHRWGIFYDVI